MHNFQNELQMLGMDKYQVGELMPIDYQSQNSLHFSDMRRCGGCGRCGGLVAVLVVVEDLVVVAVLVSAVVVVVVVAAVAAVSVSVLVSAVLASLFSFVMLLGFFKKCRLCYEASVLTVEGTTW